MLDITLKSLTLPESREEADKYLERLKQSYIENLRLYRECLVKSDDIVQTLNHLEVLYNKKWSK